MKTACFLEECDNFNGNLDCILHYSKIQNDAHQKIILHYNALRSKMDEVMSENAKYEEEAKKKCLKQFESIYSVIKRHNNSGATSSTSPESSKSGSPVKQNKKSARGSTKKNGKENSPAKRPKSRNSSHSSKESLKDAELSIDPKPSKEKRTKQTKLSFFATSSAKKGRPNFFEPTDDDMTYCEELEKLKGGGLQLNSPEVFNFANLGNNHRHHVKNIVPAVETSNPEKELSPQKIPDVQIKEEEEKSTSFKRSFSAASPELFLSDISSYSNSVICIEPSEKEIITIPDRTYNPIQEIANRIEEKFSKPKKKRLFEDSNSNLVENKKVSEPIEQREMYEDECMDCQVFYDNIVEKKSVYEANNEINQCPIKCDGWKARCQKLKKNEKPRKNGVVVIKCNSKFARRRKEDPNMTAPGIWDLNVSPRKSKPLFSKLNQNNNNNNNSNNNENYETPDL